MIISRRHSVVLFQDFQDDKCCRYFFTFNMYPHFLALFNKTGVACAADENHTIFRLSKDLPVAVAVNPASTIPWEEILNDYQRKCPAREHLLMSEYAADFNAFLASVTVQEGWENIPSEELNIIFFGFGSQDIFPSAYDVLAEIKDGVLHLGDSFINAVDNDNDVLSHFLGDFESISTLIWGATPQVRSFFYEKDKELFKVYSERVKDRFKGTAYEDYVNKHLAEYDVEGEIATGLNNATDSAYSAFMMGVESFSVEDLVTAVETLVQANAELSHIRSHAKGTPRNVKEMAVITIPEGLTWIKHSLYYRRDEI